MFGCIGLETITYMISNVLYIIGSIIVAVWVLRMYTKIECDSGAKCMMGVVCIFTPLEEL